MIFVFLDLLFVADMVIWHSASYLIFIKGVLKFDIRQKFYLWCKGAYALKKILFFSQAMEIGGAEKALLGLLEKIDKTKYEVDLFLMRHQGELMKYIPDDINVLPENPKYSCLAIPIKEVIKRRQFRVAFGRLKGKIAAKRRVNQLGLGDNDVELEYSHKYTLNVMPLISDKEYDMAISFLTPHYFVAEKVKASKKIAWIHTDYAEVQVDYESQIKMWNKYDLIASISDKASESFINIFPTLKSKIVVIENIFPIKYMQNLSDEFSLDKEMINDGSIKLLSIGRFCCAKNFDNVPFICKFIRERGINVKWYIIGYGGDEPLIRNKIHEAGMQEYVIILGKKENPYPYIRACDIYVQPSRYEGKCVSVIEAQILNKPVVITNYPTSPSQLTDGYDGIVVPMDNEGCANGIISLIKDKELQQRLIENTKKNDYTNNSELKKLYSLMGDC